jgi:hypothetical protein
MGVVRVRDRLSGWLDVAVAEWVEPSGLEGAVARLVREEGCQIVFGTYIDDTEALARIARSYPQVIFEGYRGAWIQDKPPNLGTYDFSEEAMYYLQGFLAGALSAKGKIGYLRYGSGRPRGPRSRRPRPSWRKAATSSEALLAPKHSLPRKRRPGRANACASSSANSPSPSPPRSSCQGR